MLRNHQLAEFNYQQQPVIAQYPNR